MEINGSTQVYKQNSSKKIYPLKSWTQCITHPSVFCNILFYFFFVPDVFGVSAPPEVNYQNPVMFAFLTDFTRESQMVCFWVFGDGQHLFTTAQDLKQGVSHLYDFPGHYSVSTLNSANKNQSF